MLNLKLALDNPLFKNITENELILLSRCLQIRIKEFSKNEFIVTENSPFFDVVIVLKGKAVETTFSKNSSNITKLISNLDVYGLEQAVLGQTSTISNLEAKTSCIVMFINSKRLTTPCINMCTRHLKLKENIVQILANKNRDLINQLTILGKRTIRQKVLCYLSLQQQMHSNNYFDIPFSREQLADYLNIDRSALSFVLSKLKSENIIDFSKNHFHIKINMNL